MKVNGLKVGGKVLVMTAFGSKWVEGTVTGETKTLWKVEHSDGLKSMRNTSFKKEDGNEFQRKYHYCVLHPFCQATLDAQAERAGREHISRELEHVDFSSFSLLSLKAIEAIVNAERKLKEETND